MEGEERSPERDNRVLSLYSSSFSAKNPIPNQKRNRETCVMLMHLRGAHST
jgi:hypothetical protein